MSTKRRTHTHLFQDGQFTLRGSYILGQALAVSISTMAAEQYPEYSNIEDMKALLAP